MSGVLILLLALVAAAAPRAQNASPSPPARSSEWKDAEADPQAMPASGCLKYDPEVVNLHGRIERQTFPGRPGFGFDGPTGDEKETCWLLRFDQPICMLEADPEFNHAMPRVARVQLVFMKDGSYKRYRALMGRRVIASGTLFGAQVGHHHVPLLLTVADIVPEPAPPPAARPARSK
jgi:hypothetical protein